MKAFSCFVAIVGMLFLATGTVNASLIYCEQFADDSQMNVGAWDEQSPITFSVVASPGGKDGTSYMANWDGTMATNETNCAHMSHDLGGVMPTTGIVTYLWRLMLSGDPSADQAQHWTGFITENHQNNMQIGSYWAVDPEIVVHTPTEVLMETGVNYATDTWYTIAIAVDLDGFLGTNVYLAEGMTVESSDLLASITPATMELPTWDIWPYASKTEEGSGFSMYVDDLTINSGQDFSIPDYEINYVPGDANCDFKVDEKDAAILAANWLTEGANWFKGDFNNDGMVDDIDATLFAANFTSGAGLASQSVPEPGAFALLLAGIIGMILLGHRAK